MIDQVKPHCNEIDCLQQVFPSLVERRSSKHERETPRTPKLHIHLVCADEGFGININRFDRRRNEWTEIKRLDINVEHFAVVHRDTQLIIVGGDISGDRNQPINTVSEYFAN